MLAVDPWLTLWAHGAVAGARAPGAQAVQRHRHRALARGAGAAGRPVDARAGATWPAWRWCAPTRWRRARSPSSARPTPSTSATPPAPGPHAGALRAADGADRRRRHAHRALARGRGGRRAAASRWAPSWRSTAISRTSRGRRSRSAGRWPACVAAWPRWSASQRGARRGAPGRRSTIRTAAAPLRWPASIDFAGLTFAYEDREPVLRDVTFDVRPGELVAVVGPTGSGKSTLGLLLCRLCEPPARHGVRRRARRARRCPAAGCAPRVGYVPQEAFLFSRSLARQRDARARAIAPASDVRAAAVAAGLDEEVEGFPEGWDTVVGERGLTLSGGQRQRVALARALAGRPRAPRPRRRVRLGGRGQGSGDPPQLRRRAPGRTTLRHDPPAPRRAERRPRSWCSTRGGWWRRAPTRSSLAAGGLYARLWRDAAARGRARACLTSSRPSTTRSSAGPIDRAAGRAGCGPARAAAPPAGVRLARAVSRSSAGAELLQPYLVKVAIDDHILAADWAGLGRIAGLLYALSLGALYALRVVAGLRDAAHRPAGDPRPARRRSSRICSAGRGLLRPEPRSGRLMTRVLNDVEAISELFTSGVVAIVGDVVTLHRGRGHHARG